MTPVTLAEMSDVAAAEARRIEASQEALVAAELRTAPHEGELRRRDVFDGIVRLIYAVKASPVALKELRAIAGAKAGAT